MEVHATSTQTEVSAAPYRVWAVVTDITVMPSFSTELIGVEWAEGFTQPELGAQFVGRNRHPAIGEWTTRSQIVTFDPPKAFRWVVGSPETPSATWSFALSPAVDGTLLKYTAQIGPGPSGVTMMIERNPGRASQIIENRLAQLREAMAMTLAGIRVLAEAGERQQVY